MVRYGKPITTMTHCLCTLQDDPLLCTPSFERMFHCSLQASQSCLWGLKSGMGIPWLQIMGGRKSLVRAGTVKPSLKRLPSWTWNSRFVLHKRISLNGVLILVILVLDDVFLAIPCIRIYLTYCDKRLTFLIKPRRGNQPECLWGLTVVTHTGLWIRAIVILTFLVVGVFSLAIQYSRIYMTHCGK